MSRQSSTLSLNGAVLIMFGVLLSACDGSGTQIRAASDGVPSQVGEPVSIAVDSESTPEEPTEQLADESTVEPVVEPPVEPVEVAEPLSPHTFLADRQALGAITIMPVGDSITHGVAGVSSYRMSFTESLETAGCAVTMVGSQQFSQQGSVNQECVDPDGDGWGWDGSNSCFANAEPVSNVYVAPHEGYSSHRADHFLNGHSSRSGDNPGIRVSMSDYQPDVVLLHIGSVDMFADQTVDSTLDDIEAIVDAIYEVKPETLILIANIIPWFSDKPYAEIGKKVSRLGNGIEAFVGARDNPMLRLINVRDGFTDTMMLSDLVHPNAAGETHIANAFSEEYLALANCAVN